MGRKQMGNPRAKKKVNIRRVSRKGQAVDPDQAISKTEQKRVFLGEQDVLLNPSLTPLFTPITKIGQRKRQNLPDGGFRFKEIDGVKVLDNLSNDTCSQIGKEGPFLELEIRGTMTYCQESSRKSGRLPSPATIRANFPTLDKYCDDKQISSILVSNAQTINPRKEAVAIMAHRLQMSTTTVERYFRKPSDKKGTEKS
jgi:hypothetical protein